MAQILLGSLLFTQKAESNENLHEFFIRYSSETVYTWEYDDATCFEMFDVTDIRARQLTSLYEKEYKLPDTRNVV